MTHFDYILKYIKLSIIWVIIASTCAVVYTVLLQ